MAGPWEKELKPDLSQGDLLSLVLVGTAVQPKTALARGPTKAGGAVSWLTSPWKPVAGGNGLGSFLARGYETAVIVVTEDCEIDKDGKNAPVAVAPVFPISLVHVGEPRDAVVARKRYPMVPLPAVDGLFAESYADLRYICYVKRELIDDAPRHHSMTAEAVHALQLQIVAFFTRLPLDDLQAAVLPRP